jgi:hypothetical protein
MSATRRSSISRFLVQLGQSSARSIGLGAARSSPDSSERGVDGKSLHRRRCLEEGASTAMSGSEPYAVKRHPDLADRGAK